MAGKAFRADVTIRDEGGALVAHGTTPVTADGKIDVGQFIADAEHAARTTRDAQADGAAAPSGNSALDQLLGRRQ